MLEILIPLSTYYPTQGGDNKIRRVKRVWSDKQPKSHCICPRGVYLISYGVTRNFFNNNKFLIRLVFLSFSM